jgi:serine/threonine-protein kinase
MSLSPNGGDVIEYLVAHGAYVEAARVCVERGDLGRAIQLYERVWRFADALPLAERLGDRALAVRLALDAKLLGRATELAATIGDDAPDALRAVADAFASRGRPFEAARLHERAQSWARAAELYARAGSPLDEARARELAGQVREAGLLYERLVAHGAQDEGPAARLALGRLLGRLGRHEEAARLLQAAAREAPLRTAALRALCGALLALGYRAAAAEVLGRLRRETPSLPAAPEELVALEEAELAAARREPAGAGAGHRRFKIHKQLGAGATARVYLADDTLLGQPVALKMLHVGAGAGAGAGGASELERQAYQRYTREAEAAGRLRHPNIVALHDADPALGLFVLELLPGGTLAERLAEGPLAPAAARRLGLDLLAGLGAAHERGIVHRDVKPPNVLFDAAGNAKLGDFGTAHLADFGHTQTGAFMGTVAYMAPEQITGGAIGVAADLYALGVTLFQALTGRPPFLGPDLVAQHLGELPPAPSSLRPGLSRAHDETLARALAKTPAERFGSAAEMAASVANWPTAPLAGEVAPIARAVVPIEEAVVGVEAREVGRTATGRLWLRHDPRTAREVLVEERDEPVDDATLADLRRRAAAGGPDVQRVLRLSEDRREIWYEALEGDVVAIESATSEERAALPDLPFTHFARGPAGPVWIVAPLPG